jgi:hypothetical protein
VIPYDFLHPSLQVGEHLSSGILDLGYLSELENMLINLADVSIF